MDAMGAVLLVLLGFSVGVAAYLASGELTVRTALEGLPKAAAAMARAGPRWGCQRETERMRSERIVQDMPTFLDIVTLGLSAGLSFDASLELYCARYDSGLAKLVSDALLSWRIGVTSRAEALSQLADKTNAAAMERFSTTVAEALAFGTPLSQALERQAQVIRDEQRAQVEEEIERVPVKMLIPLGVFIVPAMLLAILGPLLGPALGLG